MKIPYGFSIYLFNYGNTVLSMESTWKAMYIICVQHMVCNKSIKILFELFPRNSVNQLYFYLLIKVQENYKKKTLKSYIDAEILSPILPQILQQTKLW